MTRKAIIGATASLVLLVIGVVGLTAGTLALRDSTTQFVEVTMVELRAQREFDVATTRAIAEVRELALGGEAEEGDEARAALAVARAALTSLAADHAQHAAEDPQLAAEADRLHERRSALIVRLADLIERPPADDGAGAQVGATLEALEEELSLLQRDGDALQARETADHLAAVTAQLSTSLLSIGGILALGVLLPLVVLYLLRRFVIRPIQELSAATSAVASGGLARPLRIRSDDEIGALQRSFNIMAATIGRQTHELEQQVHEATRSRETSEAARAALADQLALVEQQRAQIREMSVPVLPLTETTLVMPLVGALDADRLQRVQVQALHAIERAATRYLILDITGVPVVDAEIARGFADVIQAARLLGTQVVLVGIRPEVAQSLVALGLRLDQVSTFSTLQNGVAHTLKRASWPGDG